LRIAASALLVPCLLSLSLSLTLLITSLLALSLPLSLLALALLTLTLATLIARLLTLLAILTLLALLTVLAALPLLTRLISLAARCQRLNLLANAFDAIDGVLRLLSAVRTFASAGSGLLGVLQIVAELVKRLSHGRLAHHHRAAHTLANVLFGNLHALLDFILLGVARSVAELLRHIGLGAANCACGLLDLLLQIRVAFAQTALLVRDLLLGALIGIGARAERPAHLLFELLLLRSKAVGTIGEIRHLVARLLLLHVLERLIGGAHSLGRALRIGRRLAGILLPAGRGITHGALRLLDLAHHVIELALLALAETALGA
jgi:hypothetical protein